VNASVSFLGLKIQKKRQPLSRDRKGAARQRKLLRECVGELDLHRRAAPFRSRLCGCRVFLCSVSHNPQSEIRNPQSAIRNPQSEIRNPQSEIRNPQSEIRNPQSEIRNP
jgi:major type 1 subunit fimbrin (pilin)